ncbi:MAG: flagellar biosynthetic protein FliQ [Deltaproteobacteria bacterium]|nr:MAG: flagellar biosynthetic protein FliQ [Deltaproteobacteria bacterium]
MYTDLVLNISSEALKMILMVSMPMLLTGLLIGVLISIIQVITQIQEMTLTFVPKIIAVFITIMICGPWMLRKLIDFTTTLISEIPTLVR